MLLLDVVRERAAVPHPPIGHTLGAAGFQLRGGFIEPLKTGGWEKGTSDRDQYFHWHQRCRNEVSSMVVYWRGGN